MPDKPEIAFELFSSYYLRSPALEGRECGDRVDDNVREQLEHEARLDAYCAFVRAAKQISGDLKVAQSHRSSVDENWHVHEFVFITHIADSFRIVVPSAAVATAIIAATTPMIFERLNGEGINLTVDENNVSINLRNVENIDLAYRKLREIEARACREHAAA